MAVLESTTWASTGWAWPHRCSPSTAHVDRDFAYAAKVPDKMDRLADDFGLDAVAYYHRSLAGGQHERLSAP